jgi:hypothetical protein
MKVEIMKAEIEAPAERAIARGGLAVVTAAVLGIWLLAAVPLALGKRTLYFRDVFSTHLPLKAFGAAELRQGRIPAFNPAWGLGQPFRGNPNAVPFYPGNLLYLVLPFWSAFNLHYALHWLLAGLGMAALARALGQGPAGALLAGITYAGAGWILTTLSFYNILAVSAWWPFVLLGAVRGGRRGTVLGGLACGLALLAGEPVTALLGTVPLLLAAVQRHGWRRGLLSSLGIGVTGLSIALPQVVATARILGFTTRRALGADALGAGRFELHAARLLELILPFPFGRPWDPGSNPTYILTLYFGIVGLCLALLGARRARAWAALAVTGFVLAWAGGLGGDAIVKISGGLARFPEKLLFWTALAAPLLAGWGLEVALAAQRAWRWLAVGAGLVLLLALVLFATRLASGSGTPLSNYVLAAALLALAAMAVRHRSAPGLVAAQLLSLLPLAGLVRTAPVDAFAPSPWTRFVAPGAQVVAGDLPFRRVSELTDLDLARIGAFDLGYSPGALYGLRYPLVPNLDGIYSPLQGLVRFNFPRITDDERANWMRTLGVQATVLSGMPLTPKLRFVAGRERFGGPSLLFLVQDPAPPAWWPRSVTPVASPSEAFRWVSGAADPVADVAVPRAVVHRPGAVVILIREAADDVEIQVSGQGGLLVVRRAYQPLYVASAEGRSLRTLPADLSLLGVEIPPGAHRVRIAVPAGPEKLAGGVSLLALVAILAVAWRG